MFRFLTILALACFSSSLYSQDYIGWSNSLSLEDIQDICDIASQYKSAAVYLPEGEISHNDEKLYISTGVSLIGQGIESTIIENANFVFDSSLRSNTEQPFFKLSGIYLKTDSHIEVKGCEDFRIDNIKIESIGGNAISISNSSNVLIDHCIIDATKYGVLVANTTLKENTLNESDSLQTLLGSSKAIYVEDCAFYNYLHALVGYGGSLFVARYNTFNGGGENPSNAIAAHGAGYVVSGDTMKAGSLLFECYSNTFYGPDYPKNKCAISISGGAGLVYNNEFINWENGILLTLENNAQKQVQTSYPNNIWIWDNVHNKYDDWDSIAYVSSEINVHPPLLSEDYIVLDVAYFLRAPSEETDEVIYEPYAYPNPLVELEISGPYTPSGNKLINKNTPHIFPNPSSREIQIDMADFKSCSMLTVQGVQVIQTTYPFISVENLPFGTYFLKIKDTVGNTHTEKIVVL